MGLLVEGKWVDRWYDTEKSGGRFERSKSSFRNWLNDTALKDTRQAANDGLAPLQPPSADGPFAAESGRYHLYVSLACPWAHRTLIFRSLKKLEEHIDVSSVHPHMLENGWTFDNNFTAASGDLCGGRRYMHQVYTDALPDYTGRVTVPVLWDKQTGTIVSNESAEIIRMFNSAFNRLTGDQTDFFPEDIAADIITLNEEIYHNVNNGVYKSGFATSQQAYEEAVRPLFETLDRLEDRLAGGGPWLFGDRLTETDIRLYTTLVRFDAVYHGHFKCNLKRIIDYRHLSEWIKRLTATGGIAATIDLEHIRHHYYYSHATINPARIVPLGPLDPLPG